MILSSIHTAIIQIYTELIAYHILVECSSNVYLGKRDIYYTCHTSRIINQSHSPGGMMGDVTAELIYRVIDHLYLSTTTLLHHYTTL